MKLSKLYCSHPDILPPLRFNPGLCVVYAKVTRPKDSAKDSHNLGKTLLIHLIDFMLLKGLDKGHFLYDNKVLFEDFVFFLEIETNSGRFVTIRRAVAANTKICIRVHDEPDQDFTLDSPENWPDANLPLKKAVEKLDGYFDLAAIKPWDYRKGVGYFLRTQADYRDVFQLGRFMIGKHRDWKPFMAKLLGFDPAPIEAKYEIDVEIDNKERFRQQSRDLAGVDTQEYDRVKGMLEVKRVDVEESQKLFDRFSFHQEELRYNTDLVEWIERRIAELNERLYVIDYEAGKLRQSLAEKTQFDLDKVEKLFNEAGVGFPNAIKKSYQELLDFNRKLSEDRGQRLAEQLERLVTERTQITPELADLDRNRETIMSILQGTDTLAKFKSLQQTIIERGGEIARLEAELEQLDVMARIDKEIQELQQRRVKLIETVTDQVNAGNATYRAVRQAFSRIVRTILDLPAIIATSINKEGNPEFEASILQSERVLTATSEDKGTSYRQLLCCAFDMALLQAHKSGAFYRFVYHDGVFEGLDNRKKRLLLSVIRDLCHNIGMQYILTVIDADMPRDEADKKIPFPQGEIILELYEGSDKGRLFQMPKF